MDHAENPQVEVIEKKIGLWTFRRSLEPLATQLEGKVLRALWDHEGYFFGVWEPEVLEVTESETRPCHPFLGIYRNEAPDYSFFRWNEGAPHINLLPTPREGSWEQTTTPQRDTLDNLSLHMSVHKFTTFQIPRVIYHTERCGWQFTIISQVQGRSLTNVFEDMVGRERNGGWIKNATSPAQVTELTEICTRVADQVVDAVVDMAKLEADRIWGMGNQPSPDVHFANVDSLQLLSPEEVAQNCRDAGMDPDNTVFGPGNVTPPNVVLDKDGNFVGFASLEWAGYAPREWVQLGTMHPIEKEEQDIRIHMWGELTPKRGSERDPNCVAYLWLNILSEKLASRGFKKLAGKTLLWRRWVMDGPKPKWGRPVRREDEPRPESETSEASQS